MNPARDVAGGRRFGVPAFRQFAPRLHVALQGGVADPLAAFEYEFESVVASEGKVHALCAQLGGGEFADGETRIVVGARGDDVASRSDEMRAAGEV